ncbi:MAG: prolyl oligopeptidase family serine peptidase [Hyphomonadaceae bacterium]|nr:prolyl oligopeptidase family serine peptidase [Hyphomonadaceae bacterium]
MADALPFPSHPDNREGAQSGPLSMSSFETRIAALAPHIRIVKPHGEGPFPVVLQFHGCGGVKPLQGVYAEAAREAGWAACIVDSYAHRNISKTQAYATVCSGLRLQGPERAGDLYAALEWARRQDWADPRRIALAGWSHGGWTAADALSMPRAAAERATKIAPLPEDVLAGVVAAFLVYPYAGIGSVAGAKGWRISPKTCVIVGGKDYVVGKAGPLKLVRRLEMDDVPITSEFFAAATHAFDEEGANDMRVRYDPELTARAIGHYQALLRGAA